METLINALPPLAVERNLPYLIPLNWAVEAICVLRDAEKACKQQSKTTDQQIEECIEKIDRLLEQAPKRDFDKLVAALEEQRKQCESKLLAVLLEQAKALLARPEKSKNGEAARDLHRKLLDYEAKLDKDGKERLLQLRCLAAQEEIAELRTELDSLSKVPDVRVRQAGLIALQASLTQQLLQLHKENAKDLLKPAIESAEKLRQDCTQCLATCTRQLEEEHSAKIRHYQAWAVRQIKTYLDEKWTYPVVRSWVQGQLGKFNQPPAQNDEFNSWLKEFGEDFQKEFKELIEKELGINLVMNNGILNAGDRNGIYNSAWEFRTLPTPGWYFKNAIDEKIAGLFTRQAMVHYLLPIDRSLLKPPVAMLYDEAWNIGWHSLRERLGDRVALSLKTIQLREKRPDEVSLGDASPGGK